MEARIIAALSIIVISVAVVGVQATVTLRRRRADRRRRRGIKDYNQPGRGTAARN